MARRGGEIEVVGEYDPFGEIEGVGEYDPFGSHLPRRDEPAPPAGPSDAAAAARPTTSRGPSPAPAPAPPREPAPDLFAPSRMRGSSASRHADLFGEPGAGAGGGGVGGAPKLPSSLFDNDAKSGGEEANGDVPWYERPRADGASAEAGSDAPAPAPAAAPPAPAPAAPSAGEAASESPLFDEALVARSASAPPEAANGPSSGAAEAALFGEEDFSTPPATGPAVDETAV